MTDIAEQEAPQLSEGVKAQLSKAGLKPIVLTINPTTKMHLSYAVNSDDDFWNVMTVQHEWTAEVADRMSAIWAERKELSPRKSYTRLIDEVKKIEDEFGITRQDRMVNKNVVLPSLVIVDETEDYNLNAHTVDGKEHLMFGMASVYTNTKEKGDIVHAYKRGLGKLEDLSTLNEARFRTRYAYDNNAAEVEAIVDIKTVKLPLKFKEKNQGAELLFLVESEETYLKLNAVKDAFEGQNHTFFEHNKTQFLNELGLKLQDGLENDKIIPAIKENYGETLHATHYIKGARYNFLDGANMYAINQKTNKITYAHKSTTGDLVSQLQELDLAKFASDYAVYQDKDAVLKQAKESFVTTEVSGTDFIAAKKSSRKTGKRIDLKGFEMQLTPEEQTEIVAYWERERGPVEPITVDAFVPSPVVVTHKPDETPLKLLSYRFNTFEDTQYLSVLENYKNNPENDFLKSAFKCTVDEAVGEFLARNNILDPNSPEFKNDVSLINKHSAITNRKSRKGEKITSSVSEFTVNAGTLRAENAETWSRFQESKDKFQHYMYFKKCDVHRDINIPE